MITHGLVHGHPAENSTAIVHGKWPLNPVMQRMVYSELLSSLLYQKRLATLQLHSLANSCMDQIDDDSVR
jgi:hypothetical protein